MATRPLKRCGKMGCKAFALHLQSYCQQHQDEYIANRNKDRTDDRPPANERGYDYLWQKVRNRFIKNNPICVVCLKDQRITDADEIDHIVPIKVAPDRRLDTANLQALCRYHHALKTAEDKKLYNL